MCVSGIHAVGVLVYGLKPFMVIAAAEKAGGFSFFLLTVYIRCCFSFYCWLNVLKSKSLPEFRRSLCSVLYSSPAWTDHDVVCKTDLRKFSVPNRRSRVQSRAVQSAIRDYCERAASWHNSITPSPHTHTPGFYGNGISPQWFSSFWYFFFWSRLAQIC